MRLRHARGAPISSVNEHGRGHLPEFSLHRTLDSWPLQLLLAAGDISDALKPADIEYMITEASSGLS